MAEIDGSCLQSQTEFNSSGSGLWDDEDFADLFDDSTLKSPEKAAKKRSSSPESQRRKDPVEDPSLPPSLAEISKEEEDDGASDLLLDDLLNIDEVPEKNNHGKRPITNSILSSERIDPEPLAKQNKENNAIHSNGEAKKSDPEENLLDGLDDIVEPPPKKKKRKCDESDRLDLNLRQPEPERRLGSDAAELPPSKKNVENGIPKQAKPAKDDSDDFQPLQAEKKHSPQKLEDLLELDDPPLKKKKPKPPKKKIEEDELFGLEDIYAPRSVKKKEAKVEKPKLQLGNLEKSAEENVCPTCTFVNKPDFLKCEMCGTELKGSQQSNAKTSKTCKACTFQNALTAVVCQMCNHSFEDDGGSEEPLQACPNCTFKQSKENEECEICGKALRPKRRRGRPRVNNSITCSKCTAENPSGSLACSVCGSRFGASPSRKRKAGDANLRNMKIPKKRNTRKRKRKNGSQRSQDSDDGDANSQGHLDGFVVGDDEEVDELEGGDFSEEEYNPQDDEEEEEYFPGRSRARDVCKYGRKCYNTNPSHLEQFAHPWLLGSSS